MQQSKQEKELVKIAFSLDGSGWPSQEETMWALADGDYFRLDNIPLQVYGVSQGDLVHAELVQERYVFKEVVKRGGHSTIRIHFKIVPIDLDVVKKYLDKLNQLGCAYEGNGATLYALDVPPESNLNIVIDFLKEGEELGVWEYEEGYIYR